MDTHGQDILDIRSLVVDSWDRFNLLKNGKSFKFHVEQCKSLCTYTLDKLSTYIVQCLGSDIRNERVERGWKEVYRAMKEAETYLIHCSTDTCWIEGFILANTGEAFALHMHDLAWSLLCLDLALLCPTEERNDRIDLTEFGNRISDFFTEMCDLHLEQFGFKFHDYWHLLLACSQTAAKAWKVKKKNKIGVLLFMERKLLETIRNEFKTESANGIPTRLQIPAKDLKKKKSIGEGSYGRVYEGSWLGQRVAIKDIPIEARDLFDTETKVLSRLDSPFIVQLIGTCIEGSHCSIVMELVSSSLDKLLTNSGGRVPLALPVAVDMMLQISRGMEYLHSQGMMHMDLRASNVLIQPSAVPEFSVQGYGRVKLCDFGMASLRLSSRRCEDPKGTCYWRAPEAFPFPNLPIQAIDSLEEYTYKADVYSFAMTCYEILTGEQPFLGVNPKDLYRMIVGGERPILLGSSCPAAVADFIGKCWETDPSRRPCFAQVSTFMRNMKFFMLKCNDPCKILLEPVRSKEEAFDEIPAHKKLMSITRVLHIVPPKIKRRYNINAGDERYFGQYFQKLTRLGRSNLTSLLGNHISEEETVYKYCPKESLCSLLHTKFLMWDRRKEIAEKVSLSLAFLHESGMVYGNVNSSNILLDRKGRACLADPCLKTFVKNLHCGLMDYEKYSSGWWGYMAPNQFYRGETSKESDVYSFGVLLLELLTGKHPHWTSSHLPKLIFSINNERWPMEMLDGRLRSHIDIPNMLVMYNIAKQCTSLREHTRPRMNEVVEMIRNLSKMSNENTKNGTFDENWALLENKIPITDEYIHTLSNCNIILEDSHFYTIFPTIFPNGSSYIV